MDVREKLIELLDEVHHRPLGKEYCERLTTIADHLIANGITITPAVPGPSEDDHNIMELCFRNGERHMKEKMLAKLAQLLEGLDYHKAVFICKCLEDI